MPTQPSRAKPLSPDDRRTAIVKAVLPLLLERGQATTTADMATAAGIAEGTIFRVFPDKAAILNAAVRVTIDPNVTEDAIGSIDTDLPLSDQLVEAAEILASRFQKVTTLMEVIHTLPHRKKSPSPEGRRMFFAASKAVTSSLVALFERSEDQLSVSPVLAARTLRALVFADAHPMTGRDDTVNSFEMVSMLLHGIQRPDEE
jgi:AcrR family transcriptional regulator